MDARLVQSVNGIGGSAQIEGAGVLRGTPPTPGSPGGGAAIVNAQVPAVSKTMIIWGVCIGVLVLFHVGGARLG